MGSALLWLTLLVATILLVASAVVAVATTRRTFRLKEERTLAQRATDLARGAGVPSGRLRRQWPVLLTVSGGEPLAGTLVMDDGWLTFTATGRDTATWRAPVAEVRLSRLPQTHVAAPLRLDGPGLREARLDLVAGGRGTVPDPGAVPGPPPVARELGELLARAGARVDPVLRDPVEGSGTSGTDGAPGSTRRGPAVPGRRPAAPGTWVPTDAEPSRESGWEDVSGGGSGGQRYRFDPEGGGPAGHGATGPDGPEVTDTDGPDPDGGVRG